MFVQLTHLVPKKGCNDDLMAKLQEWGAAVKGSQQQAEYSFISRSGHHIFVISIYKEKDIYFSAVAEQKKFMEMVAPFLVDNHGPTFFGDILQLYDKNNPEGDKDPVPHGIYMGNEL